MSRGTNGMNQSFLKRLKSFVLDRETPGLEMEICMLSPAMLTATKRSVTYGAPNEVYFLQFLGTPNFNARVILLRQRLASLPFLLLGKTLSFPSTPTS